MRPFDKRMLDASTVFAARDPLATDDGAHDNAYKQLWINTVNNSLFINTSAGTGTATWLRASGSIPVPSNPGGLLMSKSVPVYTTPPSSVWNAYTATGAPEMGIIVFTPDAGTDGAGGEGPGVAQIPAFQTVVLAAQAAGIKVLGYIATGYTTRSLDAVITDINNFYAFYPTIDGIFFDTVADNQFDYYATLHNYIVAIGGLMVLNPGTTTVESYMKICDVMMNFENTYAAYLTYTPPAYAANYPMRRFWHLVHTCPSSAAATIACGLAQQNNAGHIFVTDGVMPFPWTPLSAYEAQIDAYIAGTTAAFAPINIPGRIGEWWADNVTKDGGNVVSVVADHAAIAHDMTPPGTGPLWVANQLNGHPILRFTGAEYVKTADFAAIQYQPITICAVFKATANSVIAVGGDDAFGIFSDTGLAAFAAGLFKTGTIAILNSFAIVTAIFDTNHGAAKLYVNGVLACILQPGTYGAAALALGAYTSGNNKFVGDIYGAVMYNRSLGPTEREALEAYVSTRTGIAI